MQLYCTYNRYPPPPRKNIYLFKPSPLPPTYTLFFLRVKNYVPYFCRKPFGQDKELFEYDYDSDDDWEEEEQGESLR